MQVRKFFLNQFFKLFLYILCAYFFYLKPFQEYSTLYSKISSKIHWIDWNKLGVAKEKGGLEFWDLHSFNIVLAKQYWRLFQNPHSLVALVLKQKYFQDDEFMKAKTWHNLF